MSHDVTYRYRPDPDLFYLTGFPEPETVAVFDGFEKRMILFVREKDRERETWEGLRAGPKGAVRSFGADEAFPLEDLSEKLPPLLRKTHTLFHAFGINKEADERIISLLGRFRREARDPQRGPVTVADPTVVLHEMRLIKEPEELDLMRRSAAIAARAHTEAMEETRPGRFEYEIEAVLMKRFLVDGAASFSYPPIVASGVNATILHYVGNRCRIEPDDLVLIDAGCEYEGYASDITRTYPSTGHFSQAQRRVYDIVLAAQKAAIGAIKAGNPFDGIQEAAHDVLIDGLLELGLLKGKARNIRAKKLQQRFTLHRTSHWLGLDVHDRGRYTKDDGSKKLLEAGMVVTVEPGLYIRPDEKKAKKEYLGTGIRIEDDVLVTAEGAEILTHGVPKEADEIEALMASALLEKKKPSKKK